MNNGEYLKILKRFILDEQAKGIDEVEIRRALELKHWPKEMVELVFEEIRADERQKFESNTTSDDEVKDQQSASEQKFVNLAPEESWYQPTWPVGRNFMTDGDGGLPKEVEKPEENVEEEELAPTITAKELQVQETLEEELPLPTILASKPERQVDSYVPPVVTAKPEPVIVPLVPPNIPEMKLPEPEIVAMPEESQAVSEPETNKAIAGEVAINEPKFDSNFPGYFQPVGMVAPPDTAMPVKSELVDKVVREWPAASEQTKKQVAKKRANRFGYVLLVTVLVMILGLAGFYRFYYPTMNQAISTGLTNETNSTEVQLTTTPETTVSASELAGSSAAILTSSILGATNSAETNQPITGQQLVSGRQVLGETITTPEATSPTGAVVEPTPTPEPTQTVQPGTSSLGRLMGRK